MVTRPAKAMGQWYHQQKPILCEVRSQTTRQVCNETSSLGSRNQFTSQGQDLVCGQTQAHLWHYCGGSQEGSNLIPKQQWEASAEPSSSFCSKSPKTSQGFSNISFWPKTWSWVQRAKPLGGVWDHAPGLDTAVPEAREAFLTVCVAVYIAVDSVENPLQPGRLTRLPCLSLSSLTWPFICSLKKLLSRFKFRLFEIARRF